MTAHRPIYEWHERVSRWRAAESQLSPSNPIAAAVLAPLEAACIGRPNDEQCVRSELSQALRALDEVRAGLVRLQGHVEQHAHLQAQWSRFDDASWAEDLAGLREARSAPTREGERRWQRLFCEALAAWRLDVCRKLIEPDHAPVSDAAARHACGLNAIEAARWGEALGWIEAITASDGPALEGAADDTFSRLLVLKARLQGHAHDSQGARLTLSHARQAAHGAMVGLVDAAIGEQLRLDGRTAEAVAAFQEALAKAPELPDPCVGMAALAASESRWDDADEWVDRAVQRALAAPEPLWMLERLYAPLSVRLLSRLASALVPLDDARADQVFERACKLDVDAVGGAARAHEYELRADWKLKRGRRAEADEDFFAATNAWLETDPADPARTAALRERVRLRVAADQRVYWHGADALYLQSYRPQPPFVDRETLALALEVWERGAALAAPQTPFAWVYITRAAIAERQADLDAREFESLVWQAVRWAEHGVLVDAGQPHAWTALCRFHRQLDNNECALQAARRGVELAPNDAVALEELVVILVNMQRFDEASAVVSRWRGLGEKGPWLDAVEAHVLLYATDSSGIARSRLQRSLELTETSKDRWSWMYRNRARARLRLGEFNAAAEEWQRLLYTCPQPRIDEHSDSALALMMLGRSEPALELLEQSRQHEPTRRDDTDRMTGLAHLLRGDVGTAASFLERGIVAATAAASLEDWTTGSAKDAQDVLVHAGQAAAGELLDSMIGLAHKVAQRLPRKGSAVDELRRQLDEKAELFGPGTSHRRGALAVLGRLEGDAGRDGDALRCYQELREADPELAALGAIRVLQRRFDDEGALPPEAQGAVAETMRSAGEPARERAAKLAIAAQLHSALATKSDAAGRRRGIEAALELALTHARGAGHEAEQASVVAGRQLTNIAADIGSDTRAIWRLDDGLAKLALQHASGFREAAQAARDAIPNVFAERLALPAYRARTHGFLYRLARLRLYLGRALRERAETGAEFMSRWNGLRERVLRRLGVALPDLYIEEMGDSPSLDYSYSIAIDDVQLAQAQTSPNDDLDVVLRHLEDVLRPRWALFLDLADVDAWLHRLRDTLSPEQAASSDRLRTDRTGLQDFARLLRALADEQVPLVRGAEILTAFEAARTDGVDATLRRARQVLRSELPGNVDTAARRLFLSNDDEEELLAWYVAERGRGYLAMPPEETQELLATVRAMVGDTTDSKVLVVRRCELRAPLRPVIALEHPDLPVLAHDELADAEPGPLTASE